MCLGSRATGTRGPGNFWSGISVGRAGDTSTGGAATGGAATGVPGLDSTVATTHQKVSIFANGLTRCGTIHEAYELGKVQAWHYLAFATFRV